MVGRLTRQSLSGGNAQPPMSNVQSGTGLTAAQRAAIQKQINELLILVQQLIVKLKALRGY